MKDRIVISILKKKQVTTGLKGIFCLHGLFMGLPKPTCTGVAIPSVPRLTRTDIGTYCVITLGMGSVTIMCVSLAHINVYGNQRLKNNCEK